MKCPTDGSTLTMSERSGIEIDYCPECRGVWLDRGELDKLIDRSTAQSVSAAPSPGPSSAASSSYEQERDQRRMEQDQRYSRADQFGQQPPRKKKKESWLSEIFD